MAKVALHNLADLDVPELSDMVEAARLPNGRILLVLTPRSSDEGYQGVCLVREHLHYALSMRRYIPRETWTENWDCGVVLFRKACEFSRTHPAYFAYLLGHELGHARLWLEDRELALLCALVAPPVIYEASKGVVSQGYQLPYEQAFDRFGLWIAAEVYSKERLRDEIATLLGDPECKDADRLRFLMASEGADLPANLKEEVVSFARPFKAGIVREWRKRIELAKKPPNGVCLADLVDDWDSLIPDDQ